MVAIPAGDFLYGSSGEKQFLHDFEIDVHPVTNAQYLEAAEIHGLRVPRALREPAIVRAKANHPVVGITYDEALEFCECYHCGLPTDEEWEKAARGTAGLLYPWGTEFRAECCNTRGNGLFDTTPVDKYIFAASPYGVVDLCGNAWEWTSSIDGRGLCSVRGGSWFDPPAMARADRRSTARRNYRCSSIGFRRVRRPGTAVHKEKMPAEPVSLIVNLTKNAAAVAQRDVLELFEVSSEARAAIASISQFEPGIAAGFDAKSVAAALAGALAEATPDELLPVKMRAIETSIAQGEIPAARRQIEALSREAHGRRDIEVFVDRAAEMLSVADVRIPSMNDGTGDRRFWVWLALAATMAFLNVALYWVRTSGRF
ncbi:MAG: formylglycine-generating enzyme family protein [Planctomycetes bacterium]|nr:formylglycine-generating enzyme family protein [Planctomycetota bacterium]